MTPRAWTAIAIVSTGIACWGWGCGDEAEPFEGDRGGDGDSDGDSDGDLDKNADDNNASTAPIPGILHNGWKRPDCQSCHGPGHPDHFDEQEVWECAECHGGNGAAHPPRVEHGFERCTFTCHTDTAHPVEATHHVTDVNPGYAAPEECNGCHWSPLAPP